MFVPCLCLTSIRTPPHPTPPPPLLFLLIILTDFHFKFVYLQIVRQR